MIARTIWVTVLSNSHSGIARCQATSTPGSMRLTVYLTQDPGWKRISSVPVLLRAYSLLQVVFQSEVLRDKDCLTIFLDHLEIVRGVNSSLEENAIRGS